MEVISCVLFGLLLNEPLDINFHLADVIPDRFKQLQRGMEEDRVEAILRVWVNPKVSRQGYGIWTTAGRAIKPSILSIRPNLEIHIYYESGDDTNDKWVLNDARLFRGEKLVACLPGAFLAALNLPSPPYRALMGPLMVGDSPESKVWLVKFWMHFLRRGMDHSAALRLLGVDEAWKPEIMVSSSFGGSVDYTFDGSYRLSIAFTFSWDHAGNSRVLHDAYLYQGKDLVARMPADQAQNK